MHLMYLTISCTYISLKTILCFSKLLEKKQVFEQLTSLIELTYQLSPFLGQKLHLIHNFNNLKLVLFSNRTLFTSFCFDFILTQNTISLDWALGRRRRY